MDGEMDGGIKGGNEREKARKKKKEEGGTKVIKKGSTKERKV